jgi:hypothetical protein
MTDAQRAAVYSSHVPLIRAALEVFRPRHVLELGAGTYSTTQFLRAESSTSLEQDDSWYGAMRPLQDARHRIEYMPVPAPQDKKRWRTIPAPSEQTAAAATYYEKYLRPDTDMVFVDHFGGYRAHAAQYLHARVPVLLYHDVDEMRNGRLWHTLANIKLEAPRRLMVARSNAQVPHTGIMLPDDAAADATVAKLREAFAREFAVWADAVGIQADGELAYGT